MTESRKALLRPMTPGDLNEVAELEFALFGEEAWTPHMLADELEQQPESRFYLVAVLGQQIVGYGGLLAVDADGAGDGQADVLTLAVATGHWGNGIGSALLEALLAEASGRRCAEVFLEVRTDNTRAQRLYRRHGFTEIGIRRGYYQPSGADAIVMRLALGAPEPAEAGQRGARRGALRIAEEGR
jgi:ribosomal-protein-alanine N-acetyltransferase